jgi:hypothetical protein
MDLHVDFRVLTQHILRHKFRTPHMKVHITLCEHALQNCQFHSF